MVKVLSSFFLVLFLFLTFFSNIVSAQVLTDPADNLSISNEIIVTGTRLSSSLNTDMAGVTIITADDIDNMQPSSMVSLLRSIPSISISESGAGKLSSIYLRGANSGAALVMIDGVVVNDPTTIANDVDFSMLALDNIERIEIVSDSVSTSVGFGGMAGVINIVTKSGKGKLSATAKIETSVLFDGYKGALTVGAGSELFNYSITYSRRDDNGVSAAGSKYGNTEKDRMSRDNIVAKFGSTPIKNLTTTLVLNYTDLYNDLDNGAGVGADNPLYKAMSKRALAKYDIKYLVADLWEPKLTLNYSYVERNYLNDQGAPKYFAHNNYYGITAGVDFQNNFYFNKIIKASIGASYALDLINANTNAVYPGFGGFPDFVQKSKDVDNKKLEKVGIYAEGQLTLFDNWVTKIGVRGDKYGSNEFYPTAKLSSIYDIKYIRTKIKVAVGTGYNAPTVYQRYASIYGNPKLKDEYSFGYQVGFSSELVKEILFFSAEFYDNRYTNLIMFDGISSRYMNINKARTYGAEATIEIYPVDVLQLKGSYSYLDARDQSTGTRLLRRPTNKFFVGAYWEIITGLKVGADVVYVGSRSDSAYINGASTTLTSKAYTLLDLNASYQITDNLRVHVKASNVTDTKYEDIYGYGTEGVRVFVGATLKI